MSEHDRRTFMTTVTGIAALASVAGAQPPAQPAAATPLDITWFDAFKGKHKQVFDLGSFDLSVDSPLRQPVTYFAAHREVSHLEPPDDVNVADRHLAQVVPDERERRALGEVQAWRALGHQGSVDRQALDAQHLSRTGDRRRRRDNPRAAGARRRDSGSATSRSGRSRRSWRS